MRELPISQDGRWAAFRLPWPGQWHRQMVGPWPPGPFLVDLPPVARFLLSLRTPYIKRIATKNIL
nr:MAG TPA: hypothetical protein [Caudoviricetes sp.]